MIKYRTLADGSIEASAYSFALSGDVVLGVLRPVSEDEGYWHFFPEAGLPLTALLCSRLSLKLAELNTAPPQEQQ